MLNFSPKAEEMFDAPAMSQDAINKHYIETLDVDNMTYYKTLMQELITTFGLGVGGKARQNN